MHPASPPWKVLAHRQMSWRASRSTAWPWPLPRRVNGVALAIAQKAVDILIATGGANGTLAVNGTDVAIKGLAALAYKAQVSQTDLDSALQAVVANVGTPMSAPWLALIPARASAPSPMRNWLHS